MALNIRNYSLLCNQGTAKFNEDVVGINPFGAWVLDGATGLNGKNLVSTESDARWYVQWWNRYLYKNINKEESLKSIINTGIIEVKKEYELRLNGFKVEKLDLPSSSIVVVKFHENKVEYFLLGDCALFIKNGDSKVIKDRSICKFDNTVFDEMSKLSNLEEMAFDKIRTSVMDTIVSNRLKKNTKEGYWILDFDEEAVENSIYGYIEIKKDFQLMLTSDGFTSACDRYNLIKEEELIRIAEKFGIGYIHNKVRDFEDNDYKAVKVPRFKVKDDSSCLYLDIYND
ncbi:hypothetical protein C4351_06535 [Clostridioides difficile]|nr:hypothetical protein [Clostridioides difficile]MDB3373797.1 hypothetical protein [Clostridioides difficile]MDB3564715.1 hypothetical protein [Clostridioides difficile]MDB3695497.1 hypothetical protein [Clostridioides difficile]MDB3731019.1 hypothetical protein [Clostridioides difficile]